MPARRLKKAAPRTAGRSGSAEAARVGERFERLLAAGVAIFHEHTLAGVLQRIVDAARDVVGAKYAALGVIDEAGTGLQEFVTSGLGTAERERIGALPQGRGLLGVVIRERRILRATDIARHPGRIGFPPHHPKMTSFLGVPVHLGDRVFGNLYLTDRLGQPEFDAEDERIAVLLATQAAVAVANARLHDDMQRLLGQVRTMQHQREVFFAMMNHELRNSLTGVYGWAERLVRRRGGDPEQAAREVFEGAERTVNLLNNFLDLTRLDAGKVQPVWREVQVRTAVARAVAGLVPAADAKGISIEEQYVREPVQVRTDGLRLEQILVNLLSNAVRHSPTSRSITLRVRGDDASVAFEVCDQGPGIPADQQERIFEPFERFDPSSGMGSGLGLPLSRRLAEVLGGTLTVECPATGGAIFRLTLPFMHAGP